MSGLAAFCPEKPFLKNTSSRYEGFRAFIGLGFGCIGFGLQASVGGGRVWDGLASIP